MTSDGIRLQKALAQAGVGSRRECDDLVAQGRVTVNGHRAELGTRVDPVTDVLAVDGRPVDAGQRVVVLAFHKPAGVVSTMKDDRGRPCIGDVLADYPVRLFHVGRLDEETEGLLLLTNDGDLAHRLMHPSQGVSKTYVARVRGQVNPATLDRLRAGVTLEDGPAAADKVRVTAHLGDSTELEVVLHEGRKRIVRRLLKAVGHPVEHLTRTHIGALGLGDLVNGEYRELKASELPLLTEAAKA